MNRRSRRLEVLRTMRNAAFVLSTLLFVAAAILVARERLTSTPLPTSTLVYCAPHALK